MVGKMKRVRAVLWYASANDQEAGEQLVNGLLSALRAAGSFRPGEDNHYATESVITALQGAFDALGYELTFDGILRAKTLEGLEGTELTEALEMYVKRSRAAGGDVGLAIGTAKDLTEATARHVLVETIGTYPAHGNFPATLWQAYECLGLAGPDTGAIKLLSGDSWECVEQAAFLLACAINRFRNEEGTGHGRPHAVLATEGQGRIALEGSALVSELLLLALRHD
jgi:hypothetical protein